MQAHEIPKGLVTAIRDGRCVAFVGAGFSAAADLPSWRTLLLGIAAHEAVAPTDRQYVRDRLGENSATGNEEAAQLLRDNLGEERFTAALAERLRVSSPDGAMRQRLEWLGGIPLRAILTTNFDNVLAGDVFGPDTLGRILQRPSEIKPIDFGVRGFPPIDLHRTGPSTIKLHGDLSRPDSVVLSRLDYRRRLYKDPAYLGFLRSVFLYNTVLYVGFSFTDGYLNELRSETLSMLGDVWRDAPVAYAVMNDVPVLARKHYREVEGIEVLPFETGPARADFSGFDDILKAIHDATNPVVRFGQLLDGKRILWVEPNPRSVDTATRGFFVEAARKAQHQGCVPEFVASPEEALAALGKAERNGERYHLAITHWGHREGQTPAAEVLLRGLRREDLEVPVIVFSGDWYVEERKRKVLGLGGQGYYFSWAGLLRAIEQVFAPGVQTG